MGKLMAGIVAVLIAACVTPNKAGPRILPVAVQQPVAVTEPTAYLTRLNFVVFEREVSQSPKTAKAFQDALSEWVSKLPIECLIFCEESSPFPFMPFGPDMISTQPGIIRVHIVDIHSDPYQMPLGVLGYWSHETNELVLDKVMLEIDPDRAYMVALHELGHVFGLQHIVNVHDMGALTGWYVITDNFDAGKMIMFPISSDKNKDSKLTKLEIDLAMKNLPILQQMVHTDCFHLTAK